MPELPEVETIARDVRESVLGRRVVGVRVLDPSTLRATSPASAEEALRGAAVVGARRRAKYLLIDFDNGCTLALQLVIYGQLLLEPRLAPAEPGLRVVLALDDGSELRLVDQSGYARAHVGPRDELSQALRLDFLGPEPLSDDFTPDVLARILRGRRGRLKPLLLDQHEIAGLGNIYVDEALFASQLHPERQAGSLTPEEVERLHQAIRSVLEAGVAHRGTTFNTYRDLHGRPGGHQERLSVFQKTGRPCPRCGTRIVRTTVGGRPTYLCPKCQPSQRTDE